MDATTAPAIRLVAQLENLGLKAPKEVADMIALHNEAGAYEGPALVDVSVEALSLKRGQAAALLDRATDATLRRNAMQAHRGELMDRLARRTLRAVHAHAEQIIRDLAPIFTRAAESFTEAFRELPPDYADSTALVRAGGTAVDAFRTAQQHAVILDACRQIRHTLEPQDRPLLERGTLFATVTDTVEGENAARVGDSDGPLGYFGSLLALEGVTGLTWWNSTADHRDYLEQLPKTEMRQVREHESGFGGFRIQKVPA